MFDPAIHHRRSFRLKDYDYSTPGVYFVTIVMHGRKPILGRVVKDEVVLTPFGRIVDEAWRDLPRHYRYVELGEFIVMPNHVHGIILLKDDSVGRGGSETRPYTRPYDRSNKHPYDHPDTTKRYGLPEIVRALKSFSARRINAVQQTPGLPVWQRNYYEHIIRNDDEMALIAAYIRENPASWQSDKEFTML
jgi:REP element-mobilizing transposase RayT